MNYKKKKKKISWYRRRSIADDVMKTFEI